MKLFVDSLYDSASAHPERSFAVDPDGREWTYGEVADVADRVATAILDHGLTPGALIGIYSPNHVLGFAATYGILRAGCVWVALNYRMGANGLREVLSDIALAGVFSHTSLAPDFDGIDAPGFGVVMLDGAVERFPALEQWIPDTAAEAFPERLALDTAAILLTSGTTGAPKGIEVSNRAFVAMLDDFDAIISYDAPPRHLVVAPITHAAGIFAGVLNRHGGTHYFPRDSSPAGILSAIEEHAISTLFLPPTLIYLMLAEPGVRERDLSSLRLVAYGSAPMSAEKVRDAWELFGPVMFQGYGQSEALMIMSALTVADHEKALADPALAHRLSSAGRPGPSSTVAIMDDTGRLLPVGERGEIVVRGDIVMTGYLNQPEATAEAQAHGWHHTGDIGHFDDDGFLYIVDRKKDMIITGGLNVFPGEIERVFLRHPAVVGVAVIGIPDPKWGEAVHAAVELADGSTATAAELIAFCRPILGGVKTPKTVDIVAELPRNATGKVVKRDIRSRFWEGRERGI